MHNPTRLENFRVAAFHLYYDRAYASVSDCCLRFALALAASVQPVKNRKLLQEALDALDKRLPSNHGGEVLRNFATGKYGTSGIRWGADGADDED